MKYLILSGAVIIGTLIGANMDGPSPEETPEKKVETVAEAMSAILPKDLGDGTILEGASADGKTLVLKLSGLPSWEPQLTEQEAAKMLAVMACKQRGFDRMFKDGASVRIDATAPNGNTLPSLKIDACPGSPNS